MKWKSLKANHLVQEFAVYSCRTLPRPGEWEIHLRTMNPMVNATSRNRGEHLPLSYRGHGTRTQATHVNIQHCSNHYSSDTHQLIWFQSSGLPRLTIPKDGTNRTVKQSPKDVSEYSSVLLR